MIYSKHISTPLGTLLAKATNSGITHLSFLKQDGIELDLKTESVESSEEDNLLNRLQLELDEYFSGKRKAFSISVAPEGTEFQKKVWDELLKIPYGKSYSYLQLSRMLKQPDAVRAVAGANARNPVMILIPCHRINGTNGSLTGYAGGLPAKKFLLELESGRKYPKQLVMDLF